MIIRSKKGKILFVLHAHLPYVHHPDYENFMEERWLFEALTETYIPLIKIFKSLEKDKIPFKLTISFSPTLMEMLNLNDLREKYHKYLLNLIELTEKEIIRTKAEDHKTYHLAEHYRQELIEDLDIFYEEYNQNILKAFKEFKDKGYIEVITSNGTHGYLPFYRDYPEAIRAQIKSAVLTFKKYFGEYPIGMWLAECAYFKGLDKYLSDEDIRYFFLDTHGFTYADSKPRYGVYRPIITPNNVFVFARDPESSEQIWSSEVGYPGDSRYREFYRDIGYDREDDYIKPHIDPSGTRCNTGIKYYRITDKSLSLDKKEIYDLREARNAVKEHVKDFLCKKTSQIRKLSAILDEEETIIVAPFDAELFGHWWYEGPKFLEELFRQSYGSKYLDFSVPSEILQTVKKVQITYPGETSWGAGGYHDVWLNEKNDWIYKHIHEITERMKEKANIFKCPSSLQKRVLNQMMREVLLAQASDWPFIMTTGTTVEYAKNRVKCHINRFLDLDKMLEKRQVNEESLSFYEWIDDIFKNIDYTIFSSVQNKLIYLKLLHEGRIRTLPEKYFEIRWHARAGQGAKSASQFLTEAAEEAGKYSSSFPEYGAERSGAPMKAFNRIADVPIRIKSNIETPDVVVVIDDTLLKNPEVTSGLAEDKLLLVNTSRSIEEVRKLSGYKGRIGVIPATEIALEEIKRGIPNTVMIGALIRATDIVPLDAVKEKIKAAFSKKFSDEVVRANIRALERGYQEVKLSE